MIITGISYFHNIKINKIPHNMQQIALFKIKQKVAILFFNKIVKLPYIQIISVPER